MKKLAIAFFSIVCFCVACKQTPKTNNNPAAVKIKTKEDTLYQAVMDLHNETMAKYGKLLGYEKKAQQKVDSAKIMLKDKNCRCEAQAQTVIINLDLLDELKAAEKNMNDWMGQFNPDPKMKTTEERAAYFLEQKEKAMLMKDSFFKALAKADSLLGKS